MSWYRYTTGTANERPLFRVPLTIDNTAGAVAAIDASFNLANSADDLTLFWDNVQTDGYDIILTSPNGRALLSYDIQTFSKTNRTGTIRIDGYQAPAIAPLLIWMYWGKPSADVTSVQSVVTITSAKTIYLHRADPLRVEDARRIESAARHQSRATRPGTELRKGAAEQLRVYARPPLLLRSPDLVAMSSDDWDAPTHATHDVTDANGTDVSTMYAATDGRFAQDAEGRLWYSWSVKAGTSGTKYTTRCLVTTGESEIIRLSKGVAVTDVYAS